MLIASMKSMTCKQLGGVCDQKFSATSFEYMAELAKKHGMEMVQSGDADHIRAMHEMMNKMNNPEEMQKWYQQLQKEFDNLPEDAS